MIVKAEIEDIQVLSEIAFVSKGYWGYSQVDLESWRKDLTITQEQFKAWDIFKFIKNDVIAGFYALNLNDEKLAYLEFLFVLPNFIGHKIGRQLATHAIKKAEESGKILMELDADPNAETFYAKLGFQTISQKESSISGRYLPVMQRNL